jgi:hypothetical protein
VEGIKKAAFAAVVGLITSGLVRAQWSEPVAVDEVNTEYVESSPFLSYDGLSLYFTRGETSTFYDNRIFEATRAQPTGPFTSVTEVLRASDDAWAPWVSPDNLRLYYSADTGSAYKLRISERVSTSDPWPIGEGISELNALGTYVSAGKLTPDELIIVFHGFELPGGQGGDDIWIADRPDSGSPFGNIRNLTEINSAFHDNAPYISPDGLILYFHSKRNGPDQLFEATRTSVLEPFGSPEHLSFFDTPGGGSAEPSLSSDGTALYFTRHLGSGPGDIYVSYSSGGPCGSLVVNGGFEITEITGGGWPSEYGDWSGDHSVIVGADLGVVPKEDAKMLKFAATSFTGDYGTNVRCDVYQIIDINAFGDAVAAGEAMASGSVYFNRVAGDANTDTEFGLEILAYSGDPCSFPTYLAMGGMELATANSLILTDGNEATWQQCEAELPLPVGTDFVVIGIRAVENIFNNESTTEFDGHFADAVSLCISTGPPPIPVGDVYYVDGVNGSDDSNGLTLETAFATIQRGIAAANDGNTVVVYPAVYSELVDFSGKAITVQGVATAGGIAVIEAPGNYAVSFYTDEVADSVLKNFVIRNSLLGIFVADAFPTLQNLTIVDNDTGIAAYSGGVPELKNCIFYNNNADLYGCTAQYSCLLGAPNEPLFADAAGGDYHLKSERGRYWPQHDVWVLDDETSPCVDGGDPNDEPAYEPIPNGGRINAGAYGNTPYASMSDWSLPGDVNRDGLVNFLDVAIVAQWWLEGLAWMQ